MGEKNKPWGDSEEHNEELSLQREQFETIEQYQNRIDKYFQEPQIVGSAWLVEPYDLKNERFCLRVNWKKSFEFLKEVGELFLPVDISSAKALFAEAQAYHLHAMLAFGKGDVTFSLLDPIYSDITIGVNAFYFNGLQRIFPVWQTADEIAWEGAKKEGTIAAYHAYLEGNTIKRYKDKIQNEVAYRQIEIDKMAWEHAEKEDTIAAYQAYLQGNTIKRYADEARQRIEDNAAWQQAKKENSLNTYQAYLQGNTIKRYADEARQRIKDNAAWQQAKKENSLNAYQAYLQGNTIKRYADEARIAEDHAAWQQAKKENSLKAYQRYLQGDTNKHYKDEAQIAEEKAAWEQAKKEDTITAYQNYLQESANKYHKDEAQQRIKRMRFIMICVLSFGILSGAVVMMFLGNPSSATLLKELMIVKNSGSDYIVIGVDYWFATKNIGKVLARIAIDSILGGAIGGCFFSIILSCIFVRRVIETIWTIIISIIAGAIIAPIIICAITGIVSFLIVLITRAAIVIINIIIFFIIILFAIGCVSGIIQAIRDPHNKSDNKN